MTENQNILENISEEQLKEIKIEEVEKLLSLIGDENDLGVLDYNFNELDGDNKSLQSYESIVMETVMSRIDQIKSQTTFIEELLETVKQAKTKESIEGLDIEGFEINLEYDDILSNKEEYEELDFVDQTVVDAKIFALETAISGVHEYNDYLSKESIVEDMKNKGSLINDTFLKKYLNEEINRLENGGEKNSWTYLLLSYIKRKDNMINESKSGQRVHNLTQDQYIKHIIGGNQGFNDFFIKGYNNETSNYLIKISDFENYLSESENKIESINSRALANYFLYLESKGNLNIETLKKKMNLKKIDELYKIWSSENTSIAQGILEEHGIGEELEKIHEKFEPISKLKEKNDKYIKDINEKDNKYLYENTELIPIINNKEKILSLLDIFKENDKSLDISEIHPALRGDTDIIKHEKTNLGYWGLQEIPKDILESNLGEIIRKYKSVNDINMLNQLLIRSVYLGVDYEKLSEAILSFDITVTSDYVNIYIGEFMKLEKSDFRSVLSKYNYLVGIGKGEVQDKIDSGDLDIITKFILQNINNSYAQYYLKKFISLGYLGENAVFLTTPTNNIQINKTLIEFEPGFFNILPKEIRGDKTIIETFLNKIGEDSNGEFSKEKYMKSIELFFSSINTDNINRFLQVLKFTNENSIWAGGVKEMPINVKEKLLNDKTIALIIGNIDKGMNSHIEDEYKETYDGLIRFVSENQYAIYYKNKKNEIQDKAEEYEKDESIKEEDTIAYKDTLKKLLASSNLDENDSNILNRTIDEQLGDGELNSQRMNIIYLMVTTELKYEGLSPSEKKDKIEELLVKITDSFSEKLEEQEEQKIQEISEENNLSEIIKEEYRELLIDNKENESGEIIEIINSDELNKIFNNLIQGKTDDEITEIKNEILDKYFNNLSPEDKSNILGLFENYTIQTETKYINENPNLLYDYYSSNKNDVSFRDYLIEEKGINLEEEVRIIEEREKLDNSTNNNSNNNEALNQTIETKSGVYNYETGVIENNGNKIELNNQEKQIVESNPEAIDNIIDFYNLLNDIGLSKLWKIKDQIFNSISNVEGIGFNVDGDYLNENETKIFINKILKSLGIDEIPTVLNIKNFKGEVLDINKTQISGEQERDFIYGETYLEHMFIEKYYPRGSAMELLNTEFENSIK